MKLHAYQERAVKHLNNNPKAALWLEPGLGKTAVVLAALSDEHLPVLVTAPKRVVDEVWIQERDKWRPNLSMIRATGSPAKRQAALKSGHDVTVISRDLLKDVKVGQFKTIVIDESSGFKSRATNRYRFAKRLTAEADYVWELTGTPSPNGLLDLWSQIFLLDRGERLGTGITGYRARYFEPGATAWTVIRGSRRQVVTRWDVKAGAKKAIYKKLGDICLSMKADDYLELPPVTYNPVTVRMPAAAQKVYQELQATLVVDMRDIGLEVHTAANAAVLSGKLSQIAAGFIYSDDQTGAYTKLHSEKVNAVKEIVEETGSPVLVFYRFKAELEQLQTIEGAETLDAPDAIARWNAGEIPVLLAHPASAGMGLNLQAGGRTIIWSSLPWSSEEYDQANKRLIRQGQEHPVIVHYLLAASVDDAIWQRVNGKLDVQSALLEALKN